MTTDPHGATTNSSATNIASTDVTSTNTVDAKKADEAPKPVEVVFVVEGDHVEVVPVQTGIEDDNYVEIISGLKEGRRSGVRRLQGHQPGAAGRKQGHAWRGKIRAG